MERWPIGVIPSTRNKLQNLSPANASGFIGRIVGITHQALTCLGRNVSREDSFQSVQKPPGNGPISCGNSNRSLIRKHRAIIIEEFSVWLKNLGSRSLRLE